MSTSLPPKMSGVPNLSWDAIAPRLQPLWHATQQSQAIVADAARRELEIVSEVQGRFGAAVQKLINAREPGQLLAAQTEVMGAFLQGATLNARNLLELSEKLQDANASLLAEVANRAAPNTTK